MFDWVLQAVADGVFYAELNELLMRELGGEGYSGVEVRCAAPRRAVCSTGLCFGASRTRMHECLTAASARAHLVPS